MIRSKRLMSMRGFCTWTTRIVRLWPVCLRNAANPYRKSDQAFLDIDVDCAKLPYMLRAYYAWKNWLPFSFVDGLSGEGGAKRAK